MKSFNKVLSFVFVFVFAVVGCIPSAAANTKADSFIENIIEYNLHKTASDGIQDWIDGYLSDNAGNGAEWYVIALSKYGDYDFTEYKMALAEYLSENEIGAASSRLKYALTLIAVGERNSPFITSFLENSVGEQGIMSYIFGLHILNNGYTCSKYSKRTVTEKLLSFQSDDGGWSLTGRGGDVDVTAMTVQSLAPQYNSNSSVHTAIDKALAFLSTCQNPDGTYSSYGVKNPESISQVLIALSALGIDAQTDSRFIKNSNNLFDATELFSTGDGGFCHREGSPADATATVQVFCAGIAYKKSGSPFYVFSSRSAVIADDEKNEETTVKTTNVVDSTSITDAEQNSTPAEGTVITSVSEAADTISSDNTDNNKAVSSPKLWIVIAIAVITVLFCAVLIATKKIRPKDCIIIILIAVIVIFLIAFTGTKQEQTDSVGSVTISIRCDTIKDEDGVSIPADGVILSETEIQISDTDTVYDVLLQACRENGVHLETTGAEETLYIEGINNIYEKDYGDLSGWMYFVNGESPQIGCGNCELSDGDEIVWHYTCDMGADLNY